MIHFSGSLYRKERFISGTLHFFQKGQNAIQYVNIVDFNPIISREQEMYHLEQPATVNNFQAVSHHVWSTPLEQSWKVKHQRL